MTAHFFDQDKPHGLVKRIMLKKFLQAFIPSTLHTGRRALFIDGFAGTGVYGKDSWPKEIEMFGSPLVALRVAFEHFKKFPSNDEGSTTKIFLYFVENKLKNFKELKKNLKRTLTEYCPVESDYTVDEKPDEYTFTCKNPYPIFCKAVKCNFKTFDPPTEMAHRDVQCTTFLDPFGVSDTPMEVVRKFSCAPNRSVIINFMSSAVASFGHKNRENVYRLYGINFLVDMVKEKHPRLDKQLDSLMLYMEWVFGNFLQHNAEQDITLTERQVQKCTAFYEKLLKLLTRSKHAVTFGMRREKEDTFIYHIVFTTSNFLHLEHMKEAMNRSSNFNDKLEMGNYDLVIGGVVLNLANFQDASRLADDIYRRFRGQRAVPIEQIKYYVVAKTPYVFRKGPLKSMVTETNPRIIEVLDGKGQPPRMRGTFPDHSKWYISFSEEQSETTPVRITRRKNRCTPYPVTHTRPLLRRDLAGPSTSHD